MEYRITTEYDGKPLRDYLRSCWRGSSATSKDLQ